MNIRPTKIFPEILLAAAFVLAIACGTAPEPSNDTTESSSAKSDPTPNSPTPTNPPTPTSLSVKMPTNTPEPAQVAITPTVLPTPTIVSQNANRPTDQASGPLPTPEISGSGPCANFKGTYLLICQMMNQEPAPTDPQTFHRDAGPPALQNLLIKDFGPYSRSEGTSGVFWFDRRFDGTVFDEFGRLHNVGQSNEYPNPTFEYKLPADTQVLTPINGVIDLIAWQTTTNTLSNQDDWEIMIKPSRGSSWTVVIDHIVSIDCDPSSPTICDLPLTIYGQELHPGMKVQAGQVIGYVGNWDDQSGAEIMGRTELTIGEHKDDGFYNQCPTMMLAEDVQQALEIGLSSFMTDYESWSGDSGTYAQDKMVVPGCLYSTLRETNGEIEPIR